MNNEDAQAILTTLVLIALLAVLSIPFLVFIGYSVLQKRKRDRAREVILRDHRQLIGTHHWFPVRYASELRFKSVFKIFPWEGAGILLLPEGHAIFLGRTFSGTSLMLQFSPQTATLAWLGKAPWPNGGVSWFYFATTTKEKHYLSSETGLLILGSDKSTRAIYEEVCKSFQAHSTPGD